MAWPIDGVVRIVGSLQTKVAGTAKVALAFRRAPRPRRKIPRGPRATWLVAVVLAGASSAPAASGDAPLPKGARAVWDLGEAHRLSTKTRERLCINGLWRWQPARDLAAAVPGGNWGYFKVPGCWPGISNYLQKDCQSVHAHASWKGRSLAKVTAAWYQREITIPPAWAGRRIALTANVLNSYAAVYVDGRKAGEMRFPGGELELTKHCRPGRTHVLSLGVAAWPLKAVMVSYHDTATARTIKGSVARRGLCGDVYLVSEPRGPRLGDVKVDPSVRKGLLTVHVAPAALAPGGRYTVRAEVFDGADRVAAFASEPFAAGDLRDGRVTFAHPWRAKKLWDLHTPGNVYTLAGSLRDQAGKVLDESLPVRFGFRELWIDGRDLVLNGSRVFLSAVPLDNALVGAAWASYDGAKESLLRLKSFGINFVYAHNYGCQPGAHLAYEEILRAADDVGMLVAVTQPHFSHYDWKAPDAEKTNGYAAHAAYYVRVAQNHPSVVAYATSHNGTASGEDMNPWRFGDAQMPREGWSANNTRRAMRAERILRRLDPSRIVYHHAGDIGSMHVSNFYPNWVPIQEMSDWFEHWATKGVKPGFLCEYGAPFSWDWAMYRGWYRGKREFGSAVVPWEFCLAEWNAQFLGDAAFRISDKEKTNLRWEAKQFAAGKRWHRWDYPNQLGDRAIAERHLVWARYLRDNWRAFRTWGLSANSPWEHRLLYRPRDGVNTAREELPVDWAHLQKPGFSADYIEDRYERMDLAYKRSDWLATGSGRAILRNNAPLLAYLAGKAGQFTSKAHNLLPGETLAKQIVVVNNSRQGVSCDCTWSLDLPKAVGGTEKILAKTGRIVRSAVTAPLPKDLKPGDYTLSLTAAFGTGEKQTDTMAIHVLPTPPAIRPPAKIALWDPKGLTSQLLRTLGVTARTVAHDADLSGDDLLIVGRGALTLDGAGPNLARVRDGLKVLVFEQSAEVLEKRLGFRVQTYGLRNVVARVADHPALAGLGAEHLRDWRGSATLVDPKLRYRRRSGYGPTIDWCGLPVTRVWRCGCRGSVASVLIEKPACGDFLAIVDGGFGLEYSPLLVYREGAGTVVFCQMDVTARTEADPAAERLVRNLLGYLATWKAPPARRAIYAGEHAGRTHLQRSGLAVDRFAGAAPKPNHVLVVGPGGGKTLADHRTALAGWLRRGGRVLAVGLDGPETRSFLPIDLVTQRAEHIAAFFEPPPVGSPLAGVGPGDVHNRIAGRVDLVTAGAAPAAGGTLAVAAKGNIVSCQLAPWRLDPNAHYHTRRTFRRRSCLLSRLLGNLGVGAATGLLERFASPLAPPGAGANLVRNAAFEADADGDGVADDWGVSSSPSGVATTRVRLNGGAGKWAQRIAAPPAAKDGKARTVMLAQYGVPVEKGQWYRIALRARSQGMGSTRVTLTITNTAVWRSFFDYQRFAPGEAWKEFVFVVRSNGSEKSKTRLQIWHDGGGVLFVRDVRVSPIDPPTQGRWLKGLYLDRPVEWDDPYRFFRW